MTHNEWFIRQTGTCLHCGRETVAQLWEQTTAGGSVVYLYKCENCNYANPFGRYTGTYIKKAAVLKNLTPAEIEALPKCHPYEDFYCERCGRKGAQSHHTSPREVFGDEEAEKWPRIYLCQGCHDLWHTKVKVYYTSIHGR